MARQLFVCFGDEICLAEDSVGGWVAGDADLARTVFMDQEIQFNPARAVHNHDLCRFFVRPKLQYAASKAFRKKLQRSIARINASNWWVKLDQSDPLYHELARDRKQIEDERETNNMEARRASGRHVSYGSVIQLQHCSSAHFLTQTKNRAVHDRMSMEVTLTAEGDEGSWWRVLPAEKVRSSGEWVRQGDKVVLCSVKFQDSFLHIAAEQAPVFISQVGENGAGNPEANRLLHHSSSIDLGFSDPEQHEAAGQILLHSSVSARLEINAFPAPTSRFHVSVFKPHAGPEQTASPSSGADNYVHGSDVCTLYRRETNCFLAVDGSDGSVQWVTRESTALPRAMWRIARRSTDHGGTRLQRKQGDLAIQHVATAKYLGVAGGASPTVSRRSSAVSSEGEARLELVDQRPESSWVIQAFSAAEAGDTGLEDREVAWVELESGGAGGKGAQRWCLSSSDSKGGGEARSESEARPAVVAAVRELANMQVVEVGRVAVEVAAEVAFLGRCRSVLESVGAHLQSFPRLPQPRRDGRDGAAVEAHEALKSPDVQRRVGMFVRHVLPVAERALRVMVNACSVSDEEDPMLREGPPVEASQDRLRGTGILHLVLELFLGSIDKFPQPKAPTAEAVRAQFEWVTLLKSEFAGLWRFCALCGRLLLQSAVKNPDNQKVLIPAVERFQRPELMDLGVFELFQVSVTQSLERVLKLDLPGLALAIEALLLIPGGALRALRLLAGICENHGRPILQNQNLCLSFLESSAALLPSVQLAESGDVVIADPGTGARTSLREAFCRHGDSGHAEAGSQPGDGGGPSMLLEFYLGLLDCICVVLRGRNARAHHFFRTHSERFAVGYAHLLRAIADEELPSSYKLRCCRLVELLHIDTDPHTEFPIRTNTLIWTTVVVKPAAVDSDETGVQSDEDRDENMLGDLKTLLVRLVQRNAQTNVEETEKNRFVRGLVQLIACLLRFGFYHVQDGKSGDVYADEKAIKEMTQPLLAVLDGRTDFCAPIGTLSGDLARLEQAERTMIVMELRLETLKLIRDMVLCTETIRQRLFIQTWETIMLKRMGISSWATACASARMLEDAQDAARDPQSEPQRQASSPGISFANMSSKVAPDTGPTLREYIERVKDWKANPPWNSDDVEEMKDSVFRKHIVMAALEPEALDFAGNLGSAPQLFMIVLDLVQYKHPALKEEAISTLFALFNHRINLLNALRQTQIVCDPVAAGLFVRMKRQTLQLRRCVALLQSSDGDHLSQVQSSKLDSVLTKSIQSRPASESQTDKSQRDKAFETCFDVLEWWKSLCSEQPQNEHTATEVRTMLYNLGVHRVALSIMLLPCERSQPHGPGTLLQIGDARIRELLAAVNDFMAKLVIGLPRLQTELLAAGSQLLAEYARIEGLHVTQVIAACFKDNLEEQQSRAPEFIRFYLKDMLFSYSTPRVSWLTLVAKLSGTRENQALCFKYLGQNQVKVRQILDRVADWDSVVDSMAVEVGNGVESDSNMALVIAATLELLAAGCAGKAPAAEVFSASLVSWRSVLRMVVGTNVKNNGEKVALPAHIEFRFKAACLRFLHKVYVETGVKRLAEKASSTENGVFSFSPGDVRFVGCDTLIHSMLADIRVVTELLEGPDDEGFDHHFRQRFDYVYGAVLPALGDLFHRPASTEFAGPDGALLSEALFDGICTLRDMELPASLCTVELGGKKRDAQRQAWLALHRMSDRGRVRPEWIRHPRNRAYSLKEPKAAAQNERRAVESALQRSALELLNQLVVESGHATAPQAVPRGLCSLALMLNQTVDAPLFETAVFQELGRSAPANPPYYEIMMAIIDVTRESTTKDEVLVRVLQLVRCSLYVCEPAYLDQLQKMDPKSTESNWRAFLGLKAIRKSSEPPEENLNWLQERFDMMGATVAALRLASHKSAQVREESYLLLLGLLQGGNRKVQNTIAVFLSQSRGKSVLKTISGVLDNGAEALKDFKRTIKLVKRNAEKGVSTSRSLAGTVREERETSALTPETVSLRHLTMTLRLLQLLCEGQCRPLQQLVHRQPGLPNYDLLERCLDLFEIAHPLLVDALSLNDGELVVLVLQLLETISEMVQGPEETNQEAVLSSNFLAGCNRVLSQIVYTPLSDDKQKAFQMECSTNDLRSWLKSDLMGCILALLESCNDPKEAAHVAEDDEDNIMGSFGASGSMFSHYAGSFRRGSVGKGGASSRGILKTSPLWLHLQQLAYMRDAARLQLVKSMHFSAGFEQTLESELASCFFLLQILQEFDSTAVVHEELARLRAEQPVLMAKLTSECFEVELIRRHGRNHLAKAERVYFRVSKDIMQIVSNAHFVKKMAENMFAVPRGNPVEKAKAILGNLKSEINRIIWLAHAAQSRRWRRFILQHREMFDSIPIVLSLVMTALLLCAYGIPMDPNSGEVLGQGAFWGYEVHAPGYGKFDEPYPFANSTSDPRGFGATYSGILWNTDLSLKFRLTLKTRWESEPEWRFWAPARYIAMVTAALHLFFSVVNILAHLAHEFPLACQTALEEHRKETDAMDFQPLRSEDSPDRVRLPQHGRRALRSMRPSPVPRKTALGFRFWVLLVRRAPLFVYFYFMAVISFLGFLRSPFFHVLYLLDFFRRPAGKLVTQSLIHGGPNLLRSFLLGCVVLVCFGFFSYEYFSEVVNEEQQVCRTPYQCILKHIMDSMTGDLTTVLGNDLGVFSFPAMVIWADSWHTFRAFFVFFSLIFWVFLLQGIIQGQIIDAFAEMRANAEALAADLDQKCLVSGVDRFEFNSFPGEWDKRRGGRYVYNYLFFFVMLLRKDPEELNGLENTVVKKFHDDDVDFFPIDTFVARERVLGGEAQKQDWHEMVHGLTTDLQRLERNMASGMLAMQNAVDSIMLRLDAQEQPHS